jgi:hypothetical protein
MRAIPRPNLIAALAVVLSAVPFAAAETKYTYADVEKKLGEKYTLTIINAEGGIVTQGVTLTLKKPGLTAGSQNTCANEYKDGKIALASTSKTVCAGAVRRFGALPGIGLIPGVGGTAASAQGSVPGTRPFVQGEKLYVTKIEVKDNIVLTLVSDAINNVTYKAEMRFPIAKGTSPDATQADQMIAELFTSAAPDTSQGDKQAPAAGAAAQTNQAQPAAAAEVAPAPIAPPPPPPQDPALAPIAPPPPPPDAPAAPPQTLGLGMTIDQVVAILGQPQRVANLGTKQIYSYKDLKVTFVDGKVTDIQ